MKQIWSLMTALALVPACIARADAQELAGSFDQLRVLVKTGDKITVTDDAGREITGRIAELSSSSLTLLVGDKRRDLQAKEIDTIRQRRGDSLANGAKWGFGIGASLGFVGSLEIVNQDGVTDDAAIVAIATLFYGAVGAGIGVGVDAMNSSDQVIYARRATSSTGLTVRPILTRHRQGAMVLIGF
jgi:hypothetical protein